jgi:hypothetical protein
VKAIISEGEGGNRRSGMAIRRTIDGKRLDKEKGKYYEPFTGLFYTQG